MTSISNKPGYCCPPSARSLWAHAPGTLRPQYLMAELTSATVVNPSKAPSNTPPPDFRSNLAPKSAPPLVRVGASHKFHRLLRMAVCAAVLVAAPFAQCANGAESSKPEAQSQTVQELVVSSGTEIVRITTKGETLPFRGEPGLATVLGEETFLLNPLERVVTVYGRGQEWLRSLRIPLSGHFSCIGFHVLPDRRMAFLDNRNDVIYFSDELGRHLKTVQILDRPDNHAQNMKAVTVGNRMILSENGHKQLMAIDLGNYEVSVFRNLRSLPGPWLGAIAYEKGRFYICNPTTIFAFEENSETVTKIAELTENNIVGIAATQGRIFVVVNSSLGSVYEVDLVTGKTVLFKSGLKSPEDLAVYPQ